MKLTIGTLVLGLAVGTAFGQNTSAIQNTRDTMNAVQQKQATTQNAALGTSKVQSPATSTPKATSAPKVVTVAQSSSTAKPVAGTQASVTIVRKPIVVSTAQVGIKPASGKVVAKKAGPKTTTKAAAKSTKTKEVVAVAVEDKKNPAEAKKEVPKKIDLTGRRDPFISPVVNRSAFGSGCSTGKRCLAIDQIALKGIVRSDTGMIAVVTNALDKAYFLHENDPVFNGYVVKITGDSIVFKETVQDKLGKPFMREVTKTITTPAV